MPRFSASETRTSSPLLSSRKRRGPRCRVATTAADISPTVFFQFSSIAHPSATMNAVDEVAAADRKQRQLSAIGGRAAAVAAINVVGRSSTRRILLTCRLVACLSALAVVVCLVLVGRRIVTSRDDSHGHPLLEAIGCVAGLLLPLFIVLCLLSLHLSLLEPVDSHTVTTLLLQYLIQTLIGFRGRLALRRLIRCSSCVEDAQTETLLAILRRNADTAIGRLYRFGSAVDRLDFVASVPLTGYEDYARHVRQLEEDAAAAKSGKLLTEDPVEYLATSTGTTGRNKLIPVTRRSKITAATLVGPLSLYMVDRAVGGRTLLRVVDLSYRAKVRCSMSGLRVGPISTYIGRLAPFVVSPATVYQISDEPTALHLHALFSLAERDVGRLEALFSTLVYSFWRYIEAHWRQLCDEIAVGGAAAQKNSDYDAVSSAASAAHLDVEKSNGPRHSAVPAETSQLAAKAIRQLRADPVRAAELRAAFSAGFRGIALRVWPRLRAVRMAATGGFAHHARVLDDVYMRGVPQLSMIHAASEGFFGVNVTAGVDVDGGVATELDGREIANRSRSLGAESCYTILPQLGFYEFIPAANVEQRQPMTLFADQVQLGEQYEMVYTSPTGLYRYRTGDVIRIVEFLNQSPVYQFQYRVGQILNVFWEKTPESVFYSAVVRTVACLDGLELVDYTSTEDVLLSSLNNKPDHYPKKCYVLFIELRKNGTDIRLADSDKQKFDTTLQEVFEMYATFRAAGSIGPMRVLQVTSGTFDRLKHLRTSSVGGANPLYKVPRVVRDKESLQLLTSSAMV